MPARVERERDAACLRTSGRGQLICELARPEGLEPSTPAWKGELPRANLSSVKHLRLLPRDPHPRPRAPDADALTRCPLSRRCTPRFSRRAQFGRRSFTSRPTRDAAQTVRRSVQRCGPRGGVRRNPRRPTLRDGEKRRARRASATHRRAELVPQAEEAGNGSGDLATVRPIRCFAGTLESYHERWRASAATHVSIALDASRGSPSALASRASTRAAIRNCHRWASSQSADSGRR